MIKSNFMTVSLPFAFAVFVAAGCSYRFGYVQRNLPGGYKVVAVPVFKNKTQQTSIENHFTNELIRQFNRSQVAKIGNVNESEVLIEGVIKDIRYIRGSQIDANELSENRINLPQNSVLATEYRVFLDAELVLRRKSDQKILWHGGFSNERVYSGPQVGSAVINSVNPLYNDSARMEVFQLIAQDMMAEAHDRMTENF